MKLSADLLSESLELTLRATEALYRDKNVTFAFRYAQYALEKNPDNLRARKILYQTVYGYPELAFFSHSIDHAGPVTFVGFSPDGQRTVTASEGIIRVWDQDMELLQTLVNGEDDTSMCSYFAFSPDGSVLASADYSAYKASIWDLNHGTLLHTLNTVEGDFLMKVEFFPDGKRLLTSSAHDWMIRGQACIWEAATGEKVMELPGFTLPDNPNACISPDGTQVCLIADSGVDGLWDPSTGQQVVAFPEPYMHTLTHSFSPNGKYILISYQIGNGTAVVRDTQSGEVRARILREYSFEPCWLSEHEVLLIHGTGHDFQGEVIDLSFPVLDPLPEGFPYFLPAEWQPRPRLTIPLPDQRYALVPHADWKAVAYYDVQENRVIAQLCGHTDLVHWVAAHPTRKILLTGSRDGTAKCWNPAIRSLRLEPVRFLFRTGTPEEANLGHSLPMKSIVWETQANLLVIEFDTTVAGVSTMPWIAWELQTGRQVPKPTRLSAMEDTSAAYSLTNTIRVYGYLPGGMPDVIIRRGEVLIERAGTIRDLKSGEELIKLPGWVLPHPDGKRLLTIGSEIRLWPADPLLLAPQIADLPKQEKQLYGV